MWCKKRKKEAKRMQIDVMTNSVKTHTPLFLNKFRESYFNPFLLRNFNDSFVRVSNFPQKNNLSFKGGITYKQSMALLNECILGYEKEKEQLTKILLEPLCIAAKNPSAPIPPSVLLCGSESFAINKLVSGINSGFNKIINCNISDISQTPPEKFISEVAQILQNNAGAKNRHIVVLNNAEKYLGMNYNQAKRLLDFDYNNADKNILQSNNNVEIIHYFKSLLDNCCLPQSQGGSGTVFLFTSQNPHLIHPDFGKSKMEKIYFSVPSNEQAFKLLFDLIEHNKKKLETKFAGQKNYQEIVEKLKTLDLESLSKKQIDDIKGACKVTEREGAFSYEDLNNIAANSCMRTIANKSGFSGSQCLDVELYCAERSIDPENLLRDRKISELSQYRPSIYQRLRAKEAVEDLDKKEIAVLNDLIEQRRFEKYKLESKAQKRPLDCFEEDYLQELKEDLY